MAVIHVLYLPRDERLRAIVRTALDFVEEVYRDELLAGIRFVAFDLDDEIDVERVKNIAGKERLPNVVRHVRCRFEPELPSFFFPHSNLEVGYAWIPILREELEVPSILDIVAHELTHLALRRLPASYREHFARAFSDETNLAEELAKLRVVPAWLIAELGSTIEEFAVTYIVDNYFIYLRRTPETPTNRTKILSVVLTKLLALLAKPPEPAVGTLATVYDRVRRSDLPRFRKAIHETFMKVIKKLPADVLESNRAKYGILYRGH